MKNLMLHVWHCMFPDRRETSWCLCLSPRRRKVRAGFEAQSENGFAAKVTGIRKPPRAAEAPREGSEGKWLQFQLPFRKCHLCAPLGFLVLATKRDGVKHFAHICVRLLHNACAELENWGTHPCLHSLSLLNILPCTLVWRGSLVGSLYKNWYYKMMDSLKFHSAQCMCSATDSIWSLGLYVVYVSFSLVAYQMPYCPLSSSPGTQNLLLH